MDIKHRHQIKAIIAAILVSFLLIGSVSYSAPITEAHHPLNEGWNGCSQVYNMVPHAQLLYSYAPYLPNSTSLITIIGPQILFQNNENVELRSFLESGGTVLLADDYGSGNSLLRGLNVSARFSGKALADLYFYSRTPSFPLISDFALNALSRNITAIIMDHPTYIEILNPALVNVVALSSPFSFIDLQNSGTLSANENTQAYPVIATTHIGRGLLVLVANANMFQNELINLFNNQILFRNILRFATGTTTFDLAHLKNAPLTDARIRFKQELETSLTVIHSTLVQALMAAGLIVAFSVILVVSPRPRVTRGFPRVIKLTY
jgi:hypothetical protein